MNPQRPLPAERTFRSAAVDAAIVRVSRDIADPELRSLFERCLPNTLDTTVRFNETPDGPDTFVITGDIPAMWLRDSTAQVWPYLPFVNEDAALQAMFRGLIRRQTQCILLDPYANAFNDGPGESPWSGDHTAMRPELHERKWEIDSLCYAVRLAHGFWKTTGDGSIFTEEWKNAAARIVTTFREQQRKTGPGPYRFARTTHWSTDTVPGAGFGNPVRPVGLIVSIFRPSDDATIFPFLVPSNYFAATALDQLAEIARAVTNDGDFADECERFAGEVRSALEQYAVITHERFGRILAFEVDGFSNRLLMDDANVPGLLSLPYLGCLPADDDVYRATRQFVLSEENPYFFRGTAGEGVGSPHTLSDRIWPIGVMMQAMTAPSNEEVRHCLRMLATSHGGTGWMHESFHKDDAKDFTRAWFAWANSLFGELILTLHRERPHLLAERFV